MTEEFELQQPEEAAALEELAYALDPHKDPGEVYGVGKEQWELLVQVAASFLQRESYQKAEESFLFLAFLKRKDPRAWLGLGEALRHQEKYSEAVDAFRMAAICAEEDPRPHFHWGSCLVEMGELERARDRLLLAEEYCQAKTQFHMLRETCGDMVEELSKRIQRR